MTGACLPTAGKIKSFRCEFMRWWKSRCAWLRAKRDDVRAECSGDAATDAPAGETAATTRHGACCPPHGATQPSPGPPGDGEGTARITRRYRALLARTDRCSSKRTANMRGALQPAPRPPGFPARSPAIGSGRPASVSVRSWRCAPSADRRSDGCSRYLRRCRARRYPHSPACGRRWTGPPQPIQSGQHSFPPCGG